MYRANIINLSTVAKNIASKYGIDEVKNYKPCENCLTYSAWSAKGYQVNKGEKAIKIVTFVEDKETGRKFPKTCNLFYYKQVTKK